MYHLSDRDLRCVKWLAERAKTEKRQPAHVFNDEIPIEDGESRRDIIDLIQRLILADLVSWADTGSFYVKLSLLDYAHELNNPPPRDYVTDWKMWWFSKPILAASVLLVISLTAIATLLAAIKALLPANEP